MFYSFIFLSTILAYYSNFIVAKHPYIGANVSHFGGETKITDIYESGWAYKNGLRKNDQVLMVNDKEPEQHGTITKLNQLEQVQTLVIQREKEMLAFRISENQSILGAFIHFIFPSIFLVLCVFLSFVLMQRQEDRKDIKLLILFLFIVGAGYISANASARGDLIARTVASFSFLFSPVILLHFITEFFLRLEINKKKVRSIKWFYLSAYFLLIVEGLNSFLDGHYVLIDQLQLLFVFIPLSLMVYLLLRTFSRHKHSEVGATLKILSLGICIAILPFICTFALTFIFKTFIIHPEITTLFFIILPITFTYLIYSKRIFDVDFFLYHFRRNLLFASLGGILCFFVSFFFPVENRLFISLIATMICLTVLLIKEGFNFKNRLDEIHFQQQTIRFFEKSNKDYSLRHLMKTIMKEIQTVIPEIKSIDFFQVDRQTKAIKAEDELCRKLHPYIETIVHSQPSIGQIVHLKDGFCLLIHENEQHFLYLFCSDKSDRTNINPAEKICLQTIANYSHVLIINLYMIEDVINELHHMKTNKQVDSKWLAKFLFSLSEKERSRLASDLHDSILQELLSIYRELETVSENNVHISRHKIEKIKEQILDCMYTTRETCNELRPPFLVELGLVESIKILINKMHLQTDFHIYFEVVGFENNDLHDDYTIAFYRIVQELFNNAKKHSKATKVTLSLKNEAEYIELTYADNGIGLRGIDDDPFKQSGLMGMKERVHSLDGQFEITSSQGLEVTITLPTVNRCNEQVNRVPSF